MTYPIKPAEPLDPSITSIQPGGGDVMEVELAWGKLRRWYLKTFRKGYVEEMAQLRRGTENKAPHEVLDPRDAKYYRNLGGYHWDAKDDPFAWRDKIPFARPGLAELTIYSFLSFGWAAVGVWALQRFDLPLWASIPGWLLVATLGVIGLLIVWFFRNPQRRIPEGDHLVVSPADGKLVAIDRVEHDDYIGGPAVKIGIFLSIFNVHTNRTPIASRIVKIAYYKGQYLNALKPESAKVNEKLEVSIQGTQAPYRPMVVRQIAGAIARRIVCWVRPDEELLSGALFGMIKFGSRTELVIPDEPGLEIVAQIGDAVKGGSTIMAKYPQSEVVSR
jgi:phosphatidylserine decarboxylase